MYEKRIKIFIIASLLLLLLCVLRLIQMQLLPGSKLQESIAELTRQRTRSRQLKTLRGKILDRKGRVLATEEAQFQLHISYQLCRFLDERVRRARLLRAAASRDPELATTKAEKQTRERLDDLNQVINKCVYFGPKRPDIEERIRSINNRIWNMRTFLAWVRNSPNPAILEKYDHKINSIPLSEAIADFEERFPDEQQRLLLIARVDDVAEINKTWPLLPLATDDDVFAAQVEFFDIDGVVIEAQVQRLYPYGRVAAQTIGWVGSPQEQDKQLFADDPLADYQSGEVCGREDGIEYVCETILRGRRGELVYDIDQRLVRQTQTQFGKDVTLTLDIELQKQIEDYLADCERNLNCHTPIAAVVLDVTGGDILALVSMPVFDLNRVRYDYDALVRDANEPLRNRAINKQYPPGSVVKPLILIAGLESGVVGPNEVISCPAQEAPPGWPSCWIYNQYQSGHDLAWSNHARNAVKGSCNIYFSQLAHRIDPPLLQQWLFEFGYGHELPFARVPCNSDPNSSDPTHHYRTLRQAPGLISSITPKSAVSSPEQLPPLAPTERKYFGIGQGNLRATPLQVANAMAAIARRGVLKPPRLILSPVIAGEPVLSNIEGAKQLSRSPVIASHVPSAVERAAKQSQTQNSDLVTLGLSPQTLDIVFDGMSAVVNEPGGTAYKVFADSRFFEQGIKVYGKTGSTERPDNAWFAGFATDDANRSIAVAVVVEQGQHGPRDAAPLARDIIQFCIHAGYLAQTPRPAF